LKNSRLAQGDDLFLLFFAQDIAHIDGGYSSVDFNVLTYFLLAGFEVTIIGRFWVTAEAPHHETGVRSGLSPEKTHEIAPGDGTRHLLDRIWASMVSTTVNPVGQSLDSSSKLRWGRP
jgi:hypothetical protein